MPGGDRTGPLGGGPRTGRAAGYCAGYGMPGYMNPIPGGGFGFGYGAGFRGAGQGGIPWGGGRGHAWGGGRGRGRGFWGGGWYPQPYSDPYAYPMPPYAPQMTRDQEIEELKAQAEYFKTAMKDIENRLNELAKEEKTE